MAVVRELQMMIALCAEEEVNVFVRLVMETKKYLKNRFYKKQFLVLVGCKKQNEAVSIGSLFCVPSELKNPKIYTIG